MPKTPFELADEAFSDPRPLGRERSPEPIFSFCPPPTAPRPEWAVQVQPSRPEDFTFTVTRGESQPFPSFPSVQSDFVTAGPGTYKLSFSPSPGKGRDGNEHHVVE